MKILTVEDDPKISEFLAKGLREANYVVDSACDGEEGLHFMLNSDPDLVIADLMLPKMDGHTLIKKARSLGFDKPILVLSSKETPEDRVKGFLSGGDDYLVKPFYFSELLVRIQALLKRSQSSPQKLHLAFEDVSMDLLSRIVKRDENQLSLQANEFNLLEYFLNNPNRVLTKNQILEKIWGYNFDPQTNVVDVLVCRLRKKIDTDFEIKLIHTVRNVGYVLKKN